MRPNESEPRELIYGNRRATTVPVVTPGSRESAPRSLRAYVGGVAALMVVAGAGWLVYSRTTTTESPNVEPRVVAGGGASANSIPTSAPVPVLTQVGSDVVAPAEPLPTSAGAVNATGVASAASSADTLVRPKTSNASRPGRPKPSPNPGGAQAQSKPSTQRVDDTDYGF